MTLSLFKRFALIFVVLTLFACSKEIKDEKDSNEFVSIENKKFILNKQVFFPIMMNYIVRYRNIDNELVAAPAIEYDSINTYESRTKEEVDHRLHAHFQLIKEMGFNTLRLVGVSYAKYKENSGELYYKIESTDSDQKMSLLFHENKEEFLIQLQKVIEIAKSHQLHVMIVFPRPRKDPDQNKNRCELIKSILKRFKDEPAVFSYDFFNEPLYFDNSEFKKNIDVHRSKKEAYDLVVGWRDLMNRYAPNQLITIGYAEPIEVFEWDPSILPVDFVSFHTYHPLRVPNEIYWYSKYVDKPWMLGETSLPADNDSVLYIEQHQFMKEALKRTIDCGGSGFGWWQYQDVKWGPFEHNYTPVLNHEGITTTKDGNYKIYGSLKHNVSEILNNVILEPTGDCDCMNNYYNMVGYKNFLIKGKIINENTGEPIEGAVIRGWNKYWSVGANTFTKEDGSFTLFSNDEFVHFEISAPGMTKIKFDEKVPYKNISDGSFKNLEDQHLEYHDIGYQSFLKYSDRRSDSLLYQKDHVIFNFNDSLFTQYKFVGKMEAKKLEPLDFLD